MALTLESRLLRLLMPPSSPLGLKDSAAVPVWVFALAVAGASLVALVAALFVPGVRMSVFTPLTPLLGSAAALWLVRRGHARRGSLVLLAAFLGGLVSGLLGFGSLQNPGTSLFVVAILLAALVHGVGGAALVSAIVAGLVLGLDAVFRTPLGLSLRFDEPREPNAVWWLPLPFLVGVLAALGADKLLRRTREVLRSDAERGASEARFRAVVENAPLAVIQFDTELRITAVNPETGRILGVRQPDLLIGRNVRELPVYALPRVREAFTAVMERGERTSFEATWKSLTDTPVHVRVYGAPLRDGNGHPTGVVVLMADVSEQRRLEAELQQAQKLEAVGRLAGGIAHDFNNHLTVILGAAEMLSGQTSPELAADVEQISVAATRSAALTRQLLAFSRRQMLQPRVLNLNSVIAEIDPLLRRTLGEGIEIETVLAAGLWNVFVDPVQIQTALLNLATNARDSMAGRGKLCIETRNIPSGDDPALQRDVPTGRHVMLVISDDGQGMDAETCSRVFEPFFTTKPLGEGTGLGLSTVHGIVRQSGGLIYVVSAPQQGATFRIFLPRADGALHSEPVPRPRPRGGSERLLLVEDDSAVRAGLVRALRQEGYQVLEASDGEAASELAANSPEFDLLITDLVMPRLGGVELAARLRAIRPALRVLYVSGYAEKSTLRRAGLEPDSELLPKPFTPSDLLGRVRGILDS